MIYLNHYEWESKLEISANKINVFVVENSGKFFDYCEEIISQQNGESGNFVLFDDKKEYPLSKNVKVIFDYFNLDLNEKKMQTVLYGSISEICQRELFVEYSELLTSLSKFMDKINSLSDFEIDYNEQSPISSVLKLMSVVAKNDSTDLLSNLVNYVQFCSKLLGVKLFVFINLKTFLSEEDMQKFYKQMILDDIQIVLLESTLRTKLENEFITLIDNDLCEIIV